MGRQRPQIELVDSPWEIPTTATPSRTLRYAAVMLLSTILVSTSNGLAAPSPPFLASPPPGSTIPGTQVTFSWAHSAGADDYRLVVARDSGFTDIAYDDWLGGAYTSTTLINFPDDGTYYYWVVAAWDAADAGNYSWSVVWWFLNGSPPSTAPTLISPANGSTVNGTEVAFQWSPVARADNYFLQVALDPGFGTVVYGDWLGNYIGLSLINLPDDGTPYYWRVAAGNATGSGPFSGAWVVVNGPSAVPTAPSPTAPANGAYAPGTVVQFRWTQAQRATNYYLQVSLDALFTATFYADWVGNYIGIDLTGLPDNGTQFWWRVASGNSRGPSPFSGGFTFLNGPSDEPATPVPTAPAYGATVGGTVVSFQWDVAARAAEYYLEVARDDAFADVVFSEWLADFVGVDLTNWPDDGTQYWWRVVAGNALGTSVSAAFTFVNGPSALPTTPTPTSPPNWGNVPGELVSFGWSQAARANNYYLEVALDPAFAGIVFADWLGNQIGIDLINLPDNGTQFFWRVAAGNALGASGFSSPVTFINGPSAVPGAPVPVSPTDGQNVPGTGVLFLWDAAPRGADYLFEIAYDPSFSTLALSQWIGNYVGIQIVGFPDDGTTFYWRVKSSNVLGDGPFASARRLVNGPSALPGPTTLAAPANGAIVSGSEVVFAWLPAERAAQDYFELATDISFASILVATYVPYSSVVVTGFPDDGSSYAWRVRGVNPLGNGPVSPAWTFTNGGCVAGAGAGSAATCPSGCDPKIGTGHGISLIYSHVDTCQDASSGLYYLADLTRQANRNVHGHNGAMPDGSSVETSHFTTGLMVDPDNLWTGVSVEPGIDAHVNAAFTYDYLLQVLNLNGIDGAGRSMLSLVEDPTRTNNASWTGSRLIYHVGSGQPSYAAALDVAGHEWGHAVTALAPLVRNGELVYQGESGALNEAFSDWLGTAIEQGTYPVSGNWTIGEASRTLRNLQNPRLFNQADAYANAARGWLSIVPPCVPANDYCRVHTNSGVGNLMFYLLSEGGSPPTGHPFANIAVQGQGIRKAIRIALDANLDHWSEFANYTEARGGMVDAARILYGTDSSEVFAVKNAWAAVGVGQLPNITVQVNPPGAGTVTGAGTYLYGASATLTAAVSQSTVFSCWSDAGAEVSTVPSYTFTVNGPRVLVANFGTCAPPPTSCVLDVDGDGRGVVATDLVYVSRRLRGLAPVPPSFRALDPGIPADALIAARVDGARPSLDVDGSGAADAATDVLYIARRRLGLAPVPPSFRAANPAIPPDAVVSADVDALCP